MTALLRRLILAGMHLLVALAYKAYNVEGVNALLLIMPAKMIAPTLRKYGAAIGCEAQIHSPLIIHNASPEPGRHYAHLVVGDHCYIGRDVLLDLRERIRLGDYVTISMRCTLLTHADAGERPREYELPSLLPSRSPIDVRSGAYLGANATVLDGVTIGERAIVGACALVRQDVEPDTTVAGVPARRIGR